MFPGLPFPALQFLIMLEHFMRIFEKLPSINLADVHVNVNILASFNSKPHFNVRSTESWRKSTPGCICEEIQYINFSPNRDITSGLYWGQFWVWNQDQISHWIPFIHYHMWWSREEISVMYMCQSRVPIKGYSIVYFDRITTFKVLYRWTSIKGRAHMRFVDSFDIHASMKQVWAPPLTEV